jgi:hypothetical protein
MMSTNLQEGLGEALEGIEGHILTLPSQHAFTLQRIPLAPAGPVRKPRISLGTVRNLPGHPWEALSFAKETAAKWRDNVGYQRTPWLSGSM